MKYLGKIQDNKDLVTKEYVDNADSGKVDKVSGKGLSTNDYTTAEKNKLAGIAAGAQVNSVTGVKGNSESSYRTGNVNITAANVGLSSVYNLPQISLSGGTSIEANTNLDDLTTLGNYYCISSTTAPTLSNCPVSTYFHMYVGYSDGVSPGWPYQELINGATGQKWYRLKKANEGWTKWQTCLYKNDNNTAYTSLASYYTGGTTPTYYRIKIPDTTTKWAILRLEISVIQTYNNSNGGKILIGAYHSSASPYTWTSIVADAFGTFAETIKVYASDGTYFYIAGCGAYTTISVDKLLASDQVRTVDISDVAIDVVTALPSTYQTATMKNSFSKKLETYKQGSTTETWGGSYPVYAQWVDSSIVKIKCDNYTTQVDSATNASKVNNLTVQTAVPANAVFTDTVTTATTTGSGNAVTAISATNGALTVTKGTTFLTSHQDISGKADKSATVSTVTWDSTNKKLTKTINGTTTDVVTAATLRTGLNVADGAEVNQNAFSNVKVGSTTVAADSKTDTLELVAGSNVTLTPDATNDKVTIAATDTTYESKAAASGGTAVSLVTTGEKYTWNHKMSSIADVTNMELLTYEGTTNNVMTVGLHDDDATAKVPVVNATTGKIPASVYNNTTYESKEAASGGTAVSLVTTGEKYTWNNKQATLVSGTNIKTINNTSLLGSGNISVGGGGGTTDYSDLSNKPQINSNTLSGNKTSADLGLQSALSVESQTLAVSSSFTLYSSSPYTTTDATITLRRYGRVASVTGMVKPKSAITGSDTEYTICTVPTGYRPSQPIIQLMQGSTQYHWCLKVNTDGRVTFSRYSATTSYAQASTSTWLPFHATWIIG